MIQNTIWLLIYHNVCDRFPFDALLGWGLRGLKCFDLCSDGTNYNCVNINRFMIMIIIVMITKSFVDGHWSMFYLSNQREPSVPVSIIGYRLLIQPSTHGLSAKVEFRQNLFFSSVKMSTCKMLRPLMGFSSRQYGMPRQYYYIPNGSWLKLLALNSRSVPNGQIESTESRHIV